MRALVLLVLAACGSSSTPQAPDAGPPPPRRPRPPPDKIHVYPPHAIRADGIGPYRLDAQLEEVMHMSDPGLELLELPGGARWRVVRAEDGKLIIGAGGKNRVAFVGALAKTVARTTKGNEVGATLEQLSAELGQPEPEWRIATRRSVSFEKLANVRFFTDAAVDDPPGKGRVVGILVTRAGAMAEGQERAPTPASGGDTPSACRQGGALGSVPQDELVAVVRAGRGTPVGPATVRFGCVTGSEPEALVLTGGELSLVGGTPGKLHRLWSLPVPDAQAVGAVDTDGDGRDEAITLGVVKNGAELAAQVRAFAWDGGKLVARLGARVLAFDTSTSSQVELWPEVHAEGSVLVVGGQVAVRGAKGGLATLAPLAPARLTLDAKKAGTAPAEPPGDAGPPPDAGPRRPHK